MSRASVAVFSVALALAIAALWHGIAPTAAVPAPSLVDESEHKRSVGSLIPLTEPRKLFGVVESGDALAHVVPLLNASDRTLGPLLVRTNCVCTSAELDASTLIAGDVAELRLFVATDARTGPMAATAEVFEADRPNDILITCVLEATVEKVFEFELRPSEIRVHPDGTASSNLEIFLSVPTNSFDAPLVNFEFDPSRVREVIVGDFVRGGSADGGRATLHAPVSIVVNSGASAATRETSIVTANASVGARLRGASSCLLTFEPAVGLAARAPQELFLGAIKLGETTRSVFHLDVAEGVGAADTRMWCDERALDSGEAHVAVTLVKAASSGARVEYEVVVSHRSLGRLRFPIYYAVNGHPEVGRFEVLAWVDPPEGVR